MQRCAGLCEVCGLDAAEHAHHRRARGSGGTRRPETSSVANLLMASAKCHTMIESHRALSLSRGWLVRQNQNPADIPVMIHGHQWAYFDDAGNVTPTTEPGENT